MTVGEKIHRLRTEAGLSLKQMAQKVGLKSAVAVSGWESGAIRPSEKSLRNLCHVFRMSFEVFADEGNDIYLPPRGLPKYYRSPTPKTSRISARCNSCVHCYHVQRKPVACVYILDIGHPRGCPAGDECTRYMRIIDRRRMQSIDFSRKEDSA